MGAGTSTFIALLGWALPIAIALGLMIRLYESPSPEELTETDKVQPDDPAPQAAERR
ncbi:hypothetical protein [Elioraea sp.]|jgi:hypothetical protein|uniref:hypothetical protein n=1 Tax=Elioraea sp. TaxID=2185103 RepID=UPI003F70BD84